MATFVEKPLAPGGATVTIGVTGVGCDVCGRAPVVDGISGFGPDRRFTLPDGRSFVFCSRCYRRIGQSAVEPCPRCNYGADSQDWE